MKLDKINKYKNAFIVGLDTILAAGVIMGVSKLSNLDIIDLDIDYDAINNKIENMESISYLNAINLTETEKDNEVSLLNIIDETYNQVCNYKLIKYLDKDTYKVRVTIPELYFIENEDNIEKRCLFIDAFSKEELFDCSYDTMFYNSNLKDIELRSDDLLNVNVIDYYDLDELYNIGILSGLDEEYARNNILYSSDNDEISNVIVARMYVSLVSRNNRVEYKGNTKSIG